MNGPERLILPPFSVMYCPECGAAVDPKSAPYAEGDPTKPTADYEHWIAHHAREESTKVLGFPMFRWNEEEIEV